MDPRRAAGAVEAIHDAGRVLSHATDLSKAMNSVLLVLRSHLGLENGTVALFDPVTGEVFVEAAPEMLDEERIQGRLRPGEGVLGRVFATGLPAAIPDLGEEPAFLNRTGSWRDLAADRRALYAVPLRDGRATLGVLTAERRWAGGPFSFDADLKVLHIVGGMLAARIRLHQLENPVERARADAPPVLPERERFRGVVGGSAAWRSVLDTVAQVAPSRATVLLRGESGTGKEVVARALHDAGPRASRPFVAVNCAALPEALLESELFGHERGAFTGASQARAGRFELADGGTLFLDEVGELPVAAQVKLLRALQERQFERVGGRRTHTVDVRLVAATNRDLEAAVEAGTFRLDLYHRLQVVEIVLPPLRERREDVLPLARHFLSELEEEHGRRLTLAPSAEALLAAQPWPGNVRQLRNALERAVVSLTCDRAEASDLAWLAMEARLATPVPRPEPGEPPPQEPPLDAGEPARVREALVRAGHVQARAARILGMTVRQLRYRIAKYGIPVERF
ncbi:MAG: sigma 54-interacting transcriptional regulator [Deltaproteobacteria bacterium]|nr:sigma 54-interacting transcriptional regulator [Deltaproteobacteria bacterium]